MIHFLGLYRMGAPKDLSKTSGNVAKGILYSFTKAMMPHNKESAHLHLPTFTAGLFFHAGIFLSLAAFVWFMVAAIWSWSTPSVVAWVCCCFLLFTACCGVAIFLKRIFKRALRALSCVDDYISNGVATLLQLATVGCLFCGCMTIPYYVIASLFFLWLPVGKTKHLLYFFAARFHLGFFYGRRNSWPV